MSTMTESKSLWTLIPSLWTFKIFLDKSFRTIFLLLWPHLSIYLPCPQLFIPRLLIRHWANKTPHFLCHNLLHEIILYMRAVNLLALMLPSLHLFGPMFTNRYVLPHMSHFFPTSLSPPLPFNPMLVDCHLHSRIILLAKLKLSLSHPILTQPLPTLIGAWPCSKSYYPYSIITSSSLSIFPLAVA